MCGIAGIVGVKLGQKELEALTRSMGATLQHRGPDAAGVWADESSGVGLAHQRLSIVDLSPAGAQPMISDCARYVIVYNGEVYNGKALRDELSKKGHYFRGHSDTEAVLAACSQWGVKKALEKFIGMFAFALWDRKEKTLSLARDRLGIKPLYWGQQGSELFFGSELKALRAFKGWDVQVDSRAVASFMRFRYVPAPHSIYENVHKLEPGKLLTFSLGSGRKPILSEYWSLEKIVRQGQKNKIDPRDAVEQLNTLLLDAVKQRMVSDVPLGALLSGGIDSSVVVALMQAQSSRPVKTFSIGFHEKEYNEAEHAKAVAKHLGTQHTELYVRPEEAMAVIPKLSSMYDEPFADSSQIPTYLVSEMTRQHVTVALSGDGGDELFLGYNRYMQAMKIGGILDKLPMSFRKLGAGALRSLPPSWWDALFMAVPSRYSPRLAGEKIYKLAQVLPQGAEGFYRSLVSLWQNPDLVTHGAQEYQGTLWDEPLKELLPSFSERMQYMDTLTYLPDDILAKVDRASMAVSLEARVPLLDHRVVEFAWQLPMESKWHKGVGKSCLREVLYKYVPKELIERPKMGFGIPIDTWLQGPLKDWAEDLLSPEAIEKYGLLNSDLVQEKWQEHLSGRRRWHHHLWSVLMLQAWCRENL
ncbi:MAG: asparagine synthase (glutamine-hydrolyzing) [bacterium]|nr:asparagine synthase (glutamine-hydrolyzing) [bacterium]